jgi:hypothetical protein
MNDSGFADSGDGIWSSKDEATTEAIRQCERKTQEKCLQSVSVDADFLVRSPP